MITKTQEQALTELRIRIRSYMSEKRLSHTLAVEREIASLSGIYAPEDEFSLRIAALLHDITKEMPFLRQLQLCEEFGIKYTEDETFTPKIFHARTAEVLIHRDFPEYAIEEILSPIRWHTTGREKMTTCEILLFLADYIEDTRTFPSCVELRRFFYDGLAVAKDDDSKLKLLRDTIILSFDMTINELVSDRKPIHADTVKARNYFVLHGEVKK